MTATPRRSVRTAVERAPGGTAALGVARAVRHRGRIVSRDVRSRLVGGREAPRFAERVALDPRRCDETVPDPINHFGRSWSGAVLGGDWDVERAPVRSLVKVDACYRHWEDGVPWPDTGIYEHMMRILAERPGTDGCHTIDDVVARYARLDEVFEQVRAEGRLRSARDFVPGVREEGGVFVHFDRDGRALFGGGGMHRLAIARILGLPSIPVQVGVVHRLGLARWRRSLAV